MKKIKIVVLIGIIVLAGIFGIAYLVLVPRVPRAKSDVPMTYKIGWWGFQKGLSVSNLKSKVIFSNLNLFNHNALIEYQITGSMSERPRFRPYIVEVNVNEKWLKEDSESPHGEIILTPIVGFKNDDSYKGEVVQFDVKVQDQLAAGNWGENNYTVHAGDKTINFMLEQRK